MTEQKEDMTDKKVWFITGAGRGMGADIAKAALAAGHAVVATGRNPEKVVQAVGGNEDLLAVTLDVTDPAAAEVAVRAAVDRFGRIDVLVNNAGNFYAGFFEEISPGGLPGADRNHDVRARERHPGGPAGPAGPALRARGHHLLDRRPRRRGVPDCLRRVKVRRGGLGRVPCPRNRPLRHPHDDRGTGVLPHRAADPGIHAVRGLHYRGLCRAHPADRRRLAQHGRSAGRGPGQARRRPRPTGRAWTSRRCASPPAPTRSGSSRPGPRNCWPRPMPIAGSPTASPSTPPDSGQTAISLSTAGALFEDRADVGPFRRRAGGVRGRRRPAAAGCAGQVCPARCAGGS